MFVLLLVWGVRLDGQTAMPPCAAYHLETEQNKLTHRDKHNPSSHEEQGRASEGQGRGGNEGAAATSEIARRMRPGETGLGPVTPWNGDPAWASLTRDARLGRHRGPN